MTTTKGVGRCKYCWRPADCPVGPVLTEDRFHNKGCPYPYGDDSTEMKKWKEGHRRGFDDQYIEPHWLHRTYSPSFILGYRVGKAEIDALVEQAVERNYGLEYDDDE